MKYMKKFENYKMNESADSKINWSEVENKWDNYIEQTNNEADYDEEYDKLKSFLSGHDITWKEVKKDYFHYIESTNNEDDHDDKFKEFKSIVKKHMKKFENYKMNESTEYIMNKRETELEYTNPGEEQSIKKYFPIFYEQHKERVDQGKIKFFYDGWGTETGCIIDLETLETFIYDSRD